MRLSEYELAHAVHPHPTISEAMMEADILHNENIDIEVIDLMTIAPWDKETVFNSVAKTHHLVIVHEAVKNFGVGVEISAAVAEEIIDEFNAPILRIGAPNSPASFALEKVYLPDADDIVSAVKKTLESAFA